ncbi:ribosome maturation factor RimM [Colwellia sp. 4_MG-2023]|uniref:ribosome maturation factor RimM n=1 Tax=unclassified Colwellia TaxID=196834 RepID=UPI001C08A52B|nr:MULTISPECIES: ribosome maturation factor RimM [unclassified Colwellia]MBU2926305.1 ribosome maturation factor RimM [Colwellia sp. C2M11]MDO6488904.1 ribosome maturation factor RimM [Colwellia sp. 6_MG-2023]MDO6506589.1 ribosome maturation factor RimM [Colwellia sp. 5_MG-2023]MDO6555076.1 ribosome maturation factor RimM [Colwellia sp. 4_MG-2023]MDO6651743.1 ribosome maturation factor RimM [Colwellia sp. 3_MG-2023]
MSTQDQITLGKVGAVYGIKGWLRIHSFTDESDAILDYFPWSLKLGNNTRTVDITDWRKHNKGLVVKVAGIDDRDDAQALVGSEILINESSLPELSQGDYYWRDLIGMSVVTTQGYDLGVVSDMLETGANDVLVVKANLNDGFSKKERLIPYLFEQVVESVSIENKQICVDWDPGF